MPKPEIEFTPLSSFPVRTPPDPSTWHSTRLLAEDAETGDKTLVLKHPPGQEWGGEGGKASQAKHDFWEVGRVPFDIISVSHKSS